MYIQVAPLALTWLFITIDRKIFQLMKEGNVLKLY